MSVSLDNQKTASDQSGGEENPKNKRNPSAKGNTCRLGIVFGDIGTSPLYASVNAFMVSMVSPCPVKCSWRSVSDVLVSHL